MRMLVRMMVCMDMNTNPTGKLTVTKLKTWARANRELATTALKARALAELERARVDAYIAPIFARYGFTCDIDGSGKPLTDPRKLYLSTDEERCTAYFAECDAAHRAHGYNGEPGTCPALVAEDLQVRAENLLLDSLAKFTSTDGFHTLEQRAKALDIATGVCCAGQ
jgi:hypothetical protein